jgi:hypothetical protein
VRVPGGKAGRVSVGSGLVMGIGSGMVRKGSTYLVNVDHIFMLCAIIEEASQQYSKVFGCFVDFQRILAQSERYPCIGDCEILVSSSLS